MISILAYRHISDFWTGRAKVPLPKSSDYNDAISTTDTMMKCLVVLTISWVLELTVGVLGV